MSAPRQLEPCEKGADIIESEKWESRAKGAVGQCQWVHAGDAWVVPCY